MSGRCDDQRKEGGNRRLDDAQDAPLLTVIVGVSLPANANHRHARRCHGVCQVTVATTNVPDLEAMRILQDPTDEVRR